MSKCGCDSNANKSPLYSKVSSIPVFQCPEEEKPRRVVITDGNDVTLFTKLKYANDEEERYINASEVNDLSVLLVGKHHSVGLQSYTGVGETESVVYIMVPGKDVSVGIYDINISGSTNDVSINAVFTDIFEVINKDMPEDVTRNIVQCNKQLPDSVFIESVPKDIVAMRKELAKELAEVKETKAKYEELCAVLLDVSTLIKDTNTYVHKIYDEK